MSRLLIEALLFLVILRQTPRVAGQKQVNGEKGSSIVLTPLQPLQNEIVWKKGSNKVAEWDSGTPPKIYPAYIGRFNLDETSGKLTISNLMEEDSGDYTAEILIGNEYHSEQFQLKVFLPLHEPSVTCNKTNGFLILICHESSNAAVKYSWKYNDEELVSSADTYQLLDDNKILNVSLAKWHKEILICVVQTPASEKKTSYAIKSCLKKPRNIILIVSVTLVAVLLPVAGVLAFLFHKGYFNRWRKGGATVAQKDDNENSSPGIKTDKEENIVMKNSTDEQGALLRNNQQVGDHAVSPITLNNSPGKARGDGPR
uniref:SLAM family member 9-like n=1 Tax=Geotrypetes seraphini TaxID=260995 RepID=A0A6P8QIG6_GEOSA|nr:SLAM family member 9-like [Geotrypetes seraphini]